MKKAPLLLAVSLAANAVLLGLFLTRPPESPSPAPARPAGRTVPPNSGSAADPGRAGRVATLLKEPLDTTAARDLIARMRAAGFPPDLIRAAAQARLVGQYQARLAEILGANEPVPPFWDSRASPGMDPDQQAAVRELSRLMNATMKDLLGPDYAVAGLTDAARASLQRQYGDIPLEKVVQLQDIQQDFSLKQAEILGMTVGGYNVRLPEDTARLAELEQERRAAIAAVLTPAELEQYDLRSSNSANTLRNQLIAFEPTEDEFRTLFRLQQAFDEKYPPSLAASGNMNALLERSVAQQQLREDMANALPPDRAAAYRLLTEGSATAVARLVTRLDLPMSTVGEIVTVQREIQAQANAVRTDRNLTPDGRNQALAALQQQADARIARQIGANGLAAYKSSAGAWIQNLLPPPPPRGGAPAAR
jgi:hypothetical protein